MDDAGDGAPGGGGTKRKALAAAAAKGKAAGKGKAASKAASATATPKESSLLKQKSPAEFFAQNKNITGFDNELVENALDSAESISDLLDIEITIEEITRSKFNTMIGLVDRERIDEELYDDFELAKAREYHIIFTTCGNALPKKHASKKHKPKNAALGKKVKEAPST